jgi:tetratricopeptide (TPR) repeat protein
MRAIGVTLYWSHHEIRFPNDDHKEKEQSKAISYLRRAIDLIENDKMERAYTLRLLSQIHAHQDEYDDAVSALDASLANFADVTFSKDPEKQKKWVENECRSVYMSKAWYLLRLEKKDTALDMYNEARNLAKDGTIGGTWLDDIIYILDEKKDTDGHIVMDALKSWTDTERNSWFEFSLKYWTNFSALGRMYSAAKLSGETDIVLEWLNAFGKTLQPRSLIFFNLKEASSDFYNRVLDDVDRAKEELRNALMIQPKTDGRGEDIFHERISAVRMKLAGTIFSQFRKSCDPQQKEALVQEMRLPGMTTDDEIRESHIGMLNANMLRIMGPAREYQKAMDGIFKTCIDALEDNISWNDGYSLRLLVKVLSSLDSLERDACITLSLQFSVLDKSIYDNGADFKTASESGDTEGLIEQADTASEELGETGREKANTDINRELQSVLSTLDGLERNARTTLSLQFSIHDKSIYDNGADSKTTSKSGDTGGVEGAEVADKGTFLETQ